MNSFFRSRFTTEPSYAPIENLVFGRMAFKGMNPEVERMMQEEEERRESAEADIGDEEMAEHLAGVRAAIGRKFATKREAAAKRDATSVITGPSSSSSGDPHPRAEELMARGTELVGQMRVQNRSWVRDGSRGRGGRGGRGGQHDVRGGKKRKFLKPSE